MSDLQLEFLLAEDLRSASIVIGAKHPPDELDADAIAAMVHDRGVVLKPEYDQQLREAIDEFRTNPKRTSLVVAEATAPENGEDGWLEWVEGFDPLETRRPSPADRADQDGAVNFYNARQFVNVKAQAHVATIFPPTNGADGLDVTGQALPARPGRPLRLTIEPTLEVEPDGRVVTREAGVLKCEHGALLVARVLEIPKYVDFSTGNIEFEGSVSVGEGVRDRFVVRASENIVVHGLIEAATISCGGDFICKCGMAAKDRGQVTVNGNAEIGYFNFVRGFVRQNLTVRRELIDCELVIGAELNGESASIIGGQIAVGGSVRLAAIGAPVGTPTTVVLGTVPLLARQLQRVAEREQQAEKDIAAHRAALDSLEAVGGRVSDEERQRRDAMREQIAASERVLAACLAKREELQAQARAEQKIHLEVQKRIHPGVTLRVPPNEFYLHHALKGPLTIYHGPDRQLMIRRGESPGQPLSDVLGGLSEAA